MNPRRTLRLMGVLCLAALAGCGSPHMVAAPQYAQRLVLTPSNRFQSRTVQIAPNASECWAIAQVRSDLRYARCYDTLTLQLGPGQHRLGWTRRFASIRQCVARLTPEQLRSGCGDYLVTCTGARNDRCPPAWSSQTSIQFRTNGRRMAAESVTCGAGRFHQFHYHLHWCGATHGLPPTMVRWLSAGDNYELDIPRVVQVGTEERVMLRPDGAILYGGCC